MDIGQAIRTLRTQQGITQAQLGMRCGLSDQAISNIETGKAFPPKGTIERICTALDIPTSYLVLTSLNEDDIPKEKRILYRTLLEPLRNELLDKGTLLG